MCWTISVEDKFGSYGLVGVVITSVVDEVMIIDTFLMSCRVLGRGVEKSILAGLKRYAQENSIARVEMPFVPTAKNRPALDFIENSSFNLKSECLYQMSVDDLPIVDSFVDFYFDKGITTLKNETTQEDKIIVIESVEEEQKTFNDFQFNLLETLPKEDIDSIVHKKFYEPLLHHKGSDRVELMASDTDISQEYIAPKNENQKKLASIYQELLNIKSIGINDNFFNLGGHSLLATRVLSRVYQTFKISLTLKDIFDNPTIASLEKLLDVEKRSDKEIKKAPNMRHYPLSVMQKRVWLIDQMGGGVAYSMPVAIEVLGRLDVKKLSSVFDMITQRHEILRTKIVTIDNKPVQEIQSRLDIEISVQKVNKEEIVADIERDSNIVFNLSELPLFRVKIYKLKKDKFVIYFNMNHIISDGWSMGVITKEITALYNNQDLEDLSLQYKDFSFWQETQYTQESEDREYWYDRLSPKIEPLAFPTDYPRFKEQSFNGNTITLDLTSEVENIEKFSREYSVTLFMFLVSSIKAILARYTMQSDIVLGYPVSGRESIELENQIGFYANTLILRNSVDFESDFVMLINQVKESLLEANTHQNYPFEKLLEALNIERDLSRSPLFDYTISLNGDDGQALKLGKSEIRPFEFDFNMSQFDMSFNFVSSNEGLYLNLNYNTDLFAKESMQGFLENIDRLMTTLLKNPSQKIKELEYLNPKKTQKSFRSKTLKEHSIMSLFDRQVDKRAKNIALTYDKNQNSYKELDKKSNALSHYLEDNFDIQKGDRVALLLDRESSVIAILAILKLGACFVPINLSMPQDKIEYILQDANIKVLLKSDDIDKSGKYSKKSISKKSDINATAYIIYTSGTTGNPKGVEVSQRSLLNLLHWYIDDFDIDKKTKALLMIPTSFDASIKNILAPLITGGELIISKEQFDPFYLLNVIEKNKITLINCVPSAFSALLDVSDREYKRLKSLKYLALGGEALDLSLLQDYYLHSNIKIFNIYGPTEATDITTIYEVKKDDFDKSSVSIGRPITNSKVYILDKFDNILPKGAVGEIAIAGEGVAKGYINNLSLTSQSFIDIPNLGRVYKTGDLAKELSNGELEFL
ncbi:AMP-binding protein, partial [Sulfurovum sp. bin170]|uniref:condensation domain-containing protein n=1 Tax=Sulfurovum sp. bin170 TaxID=2695268 RepID=UPI0013DE9AFB|nr:AMP-binding protein [Sulfurovum sp. bin170]